MNTLRERIQDDMKAAMRSRDAERLGAIRLLIAAIRQREVDERLDLDEAAIVSIVEKMIKQRRDAADQMEKGGRPELAARELAEISVLEVYRPQQLSLEAIDLAIGDALAQSGASGPAAMGKVMALLKPVLAGKADMAVVSARLKARLA